MELLGGNELRAAKLLTSDHSELPDIFLFSLSFPLFRARLSPNKKRKKMAASMFDCSIVPSPSYFELTVAVPFSSRYLLFFNVFFFLNTSQVFVGW